jgi:hypothetical protein
MKLSGEASLKYLPLKGDETGVRGLGRTILHLNAKRCICKSDMIPAFLGEKPLDR